MKELFTEELKLDFNSKQKAFESFQTLEEREKKLNFICSLTVIVFYLLGIVVASCWFGFSSVIQSIGLPLTGALSLVYIFIKNDNLFDQKIAMYEGLKISIEQQEPSDKNENAKIAINDVDVIIKEMINSKISKDIKE